MMLRYRMNPIATVTQQRHLKCFGLETFPNLPFNIKYKYSHGKKITFHLTTTFHL